MFGFKGIVAALVLGAVLWQAGLLDPAIHAFTHGTSAVKPRRGVHLHVTRQ